MQKEEGGKYLMSSMSDIIEQYLKQILHSNDKKMIEIKRSELAD